WNKMHLKLGKHENSPYSIEKPAEFEEMKKVARDLSRDFKFVRVDLYDVEGRVYFSELTYVPTG
ncbi:MAG: carbonic anhydrase, partial [Lachnospiraceae bacterium]|nr:carbonic anhydrase [Lachnospiraceae bacterium]